MTSVALPAVKGTITRIGFAGQTCARPSVPAAVNAVSAMAAASNRRRDVSLDTCAPCGLVLLVGSLISPQYTMPAYHVGARSASLRPSRASKIGG